MPTSRKGQKRIFIVIAQESLRDELVGFFPISRWNHQSVLPLILIRNHSRFLCTPGTCTVTGLPFGIGIRFVSWLNEFPTVIQVSSGAILSTANTCEYDDTRFSRTKGPYWREQPKRFIIDTDLKPSAKSTSQHCVHVRHDICQIGYVLVRL